MKNSKLKKTLSVIFNVLLWAFVAFSVLMTILVFSAQGSPDSIPSLMGRSLITIQSDSMNPTLKTGDLIIDKVLTDDEKTQLKKDDIITYFVDLNGDGVNELNTHRIVDVYEENGNTYYITKGDNKKTNPVNDKEPVVHTDVLAKYTGTRLSKAGTVLNFLQSSMGFLLVIVIPLVLFFIFELCNFIALIVKLKGKKNLSAEEEDEIKKRAVEEYLRQQQEAQAQETQAQETQAQETQAQETQAQETQASQAEAPQAEVPQTEEPQTTEAQEPQQNEEEKKESDE